MTQDEIIGFIDTGIFSDRCSSPKLIETHISWVILCDEFVYKIKKPIRYSFLDFSEINNRLFYCREEIRLNWRLTFNLYLNIVEIRNNNEKIEIGGTKGNLLDYAVRMRKLNPHRQMDRLLKQDVVTDDDVRRLALMLVRFHKKTLVVKNKNISDIKTKFDDLLTESKYVQQVLDKKACEIIENAVTQSSTFLTKNSSKMETRLKQGFYRDGHGDLHTKNIFLFLDPVIFDCIEFNEDHRQIDILNEIAFLCMDLDAMGREDLSDLFLKYYCEFFPLSLSDGDMQLFTYYKGYRANVRAKVNCLRSKSAINKQESETAIYEIRRYLLLMKQYMLTLG